MIVSHLIIVASFWARGELQESFGIDIASDALISAGSGSRVSKDSILCC
jgi:hypothetical protein